MAEESQTELTFVSEEARLTAMDEFDEKSGNVEDLQKIRDAKIKVLEEPKEEGAEDTEPDKGETPPETPPIPEPKPEVPEPAPEEKLPEAPPEEQKEFVLKKEDLPERYKSPGEAFKALNEAQALIERQGEKIQRMLEETSKRAVVAETELKATQEQAGIPKVPAAESKDVPESKMSQIIALQKEIAAIEDPFEEKAIVKNRELNTLLIDEVARNATITNNAITEAQTVRKSFDEYKNIRETDLQTEQSREALKKEFVSMDDFAKEYKDEFAISKETAVVDREYIDWRKKVAVQYYDGILPDANTEEGKKQLNYAMYMLNQGSPDLIEKCRTANIPTVPDKDMKNYLKICELMDYRDGVKLDPTTQKRIQLTKFNPSSGQFVPDGFPTLKAALEHKRVESGYYKQRELDANRKGAKSFSDALTKRDTKELESETGSQAEIQLSIETASKTIDDFDMEKARKEYHATGDPKVYADFNAARIKLGQPPMDLTNVATLK